MPLEKSSVHSTDVLLPAGIRTMLDRLRYFETEEGRLKGLEFQPKPSDVAISTSPKCGTTWMQQICHQLRCLHLLDGDDGVDNDDDNDDGIMDSFDEISQVIPFLEVATDCGQDLEAPHAYQGQELPFRVYKTHAWATHCPPFHRVIVIVRNPIDVVASFHHFFENWFFESGTVTVDEFATHFWLARDVPENQMQNASYFVHLVSWYQRAFPQQQQPDFNADAAHQQQSVLFLCFEDMVENLEREVRRVADFVLPLDDCRAPEQQLRRHQLIRRVTERSSFEYMKSHASKFDEHFTKLHRDAACGLPLPMPPDPASPLAGGGGGSKIRQGRVGQAHDLLSPEVKQQIQQKWNDIVKPVTGCDTYEDFRHHVRELQTGRAAS